MFLRPVGPVVVGQVQSITLVVVMGQSVTESDGLLVESFVNGHSVGFVTQGQSVEGLNVGQDCKVVTSDC